MLNPLAGEFKPISLETNSSPKREKRRPSRKASTGDAKKPDIAKNTKKPTSHTPPTKKKDSQANSHKKHKDEGNNKRRPSRHETVATSNLNEQFRQEVKFIAIEAAIDPIYRINNTVDSSSSIEKQFEHGYERYIDWMNRSLKLYEMITVVGMENAIVDVVSITSILQERKIGVHEEVETFTTIQENGRKTSGIQVKIHSYL